MQSWVAEVSCRPIEPPPCSPARAPRCADGPASGGRRFRSCATGSALRLLCEPALAARVPSSWAGLEATAYVGVETVRVVCGGEQVEFPRARRGRRTVRYRHYLRELAKKPQAVRQVAPELVAELGEPYGRLWELLVSCHGDREAARVLARIVGAIVDHGEAEVTAALSRAVTRERCDLLALSVGSLPATTSCITVPPALAGYAVESARASDYDWLLGQGGRS